MVKKLFPFRKSKASKGYVGLEIRPDGLAMAIIKDPANSESIDYLFQPCSAADRAKTLGELVADQKVSGMMCHVALPFDQYKVYPVDKPEVEDAELADAVRWKIKDLLDFELDDAVSDVYSFPSDALRGRPEQVNVVVCRKAIVKNVVDLIAESELELACIDIGDMALRNIALTHAGESERAVALLYLRKGAGYMAFVKNQQLYLSRHFEFSLEALGDPAQQESVLQYLALEIQRSFDYFESQLGQIPPQELVLFGPDPNIPLANMLGGNISARIGALELPCLQEGDALAAINALVATGAVMRRGDQL